MPYSPLFLRRVLCCTLLAFCCTRHHIFVAAPLKVLRATGSSPYRRRALPSRDTAAVLLLSFVNTLPSLVRVNRGTYTLRGGKTCSGISFRLPMTCFCAFWTLLFAIAWLYLRTAEDPMPQHHPLACYTPLFNASCYYFSAARSPLFLRQLAGFCLVTPRHH